MYILCFIIGSLMLIVLQADHLCIQIKTGKGYYRYPTEDVITKLIIG